MGACQSKKNKINKNNNAKYKINILIPQDNIPQIKAKYYSSTPNILTLKEEYDADIFEHYTDTEIILLNRLFRDLMKRSPDDTISKETFLDYFELPGILGDRLFAVFDENLNEVIDFAEFLGGLSRYNHGSLQDRVAMLFQIYDMDGDNTVNREELSLILTTVITPTTSILYSKEYKDAEEDTLQTANAISRQTVANMVHEAFAMCDPDNTGTLTQQQFAKWVQQHPAALQMLETVLAKHIWSSADRHSNTQKIDLTAALDVLSLSTSTLQLHVDEIPKKGVLYTRECETCDTHYYYVVKDKFLYAFESEKDRSPIKVMFVAGWYINKGYIWNGLYGIEMTPPTFINHMKTQKILYSKTEQDRSEWINCLQTAAATLSIAEFYDIGHVLATTYFSKVHLGSHKGTNKEYAIKIVDKSCIDSGERLNLRNEIAMMKLVDHPSIIKLCDVYADQVSIYMVMTLAPFGNLFNRWKKRRIFEHDIARIMIWKLLEAIQYLHSLGIVHRDLKPENILCLDEEDDTQIVISDFGLSKFIAPHALCTMPCGTLCYVAPEVLTMTAYGKKVDVWSLGCIMHLLLRGVLPFDGYTEDQIREKTLHKTLNLSHVKFQNVSDEAKDLIKNLLIKDPKDRFSIQDALGHRWFDKCNKTEQRINNYH